MIGSLPDVRHNKAIYIARRYIIIYQLFLMQNVQYKRKCPHSSFYPNYTKVSQWPCAHWLLIILYLFVESRLTILKFPVRYRRVFHLHTVVYTHSTTSKHCCVHNLHTLCTHTITLEHCFVQTPTLSSKEDCPEWIFQAFVWQI